MIQSLKGKVKLQVGRRLLRMNRRALKARGNFRAERLSEELWGFHADAGRLTLREVDVEAVARRYGTPLHLVDTVRLESNYRMFLDAFRGTRASVRLATSYKTNPIPFVLERLHRWGTMAEVISGFELWLALQLGLPGERVIFNGPGKDRKSLELAVERGVRLVNADSVEELDELEKVCASRGRCQDVGIRVTTEVGWRSQFGLPIRDGSAFAAFARAARSAYLRPVGLHLHLGTGVGEAAIYERGVAEVLEFARRLHFELGTPVRVVDLGGGFGVPTTRTKTGWDRRMQQLGLPIRSAEPHRGPTPADYAARIIPLVESHLDTVQLDDLELVFEPGRAVTASAQTLLLSVLRVKTVGRPTRDVILDGGLNLCAPLSWEFHEIHPVGKMHQSKLRPHNLYGPLCHPHDILVLNKPLPVLEPGDVLAIMDAGAYFVPNQTNFSNPRPGVVAVDQTGFRLIRRSETFEDMVALDATGNFQFHHD